MKKLLLLLIPIGILLAQTSGRYLLPIWSGNHYEIGRASCRETV